MASRYFMKQIAARWSGIDPPQSLLIRQFPPSQKALNPL